MRLLIVSDSHGNRTMLEELREKYQDKVDGMIHCGDSELSKDDPALEGYHVVGGNCDFDRHYPNELVIDIKDTIIFIAHGHLHHIHTSLQNIAYRAKENNAQYVFFGHSHLLGAEYVEGTLFLNPGSILLPRGGNEKSYALVTKKGSQHKVQFFNDVHNELKQFSQTFTIEVS